MKRIKTLVAAFFVALVGTFALMPASSTFALDPLGDICSSNPDSEVCKSKDDNANKLIGTIVNP